MVEFVDLEFGTHGFLKNHVFLPTERAGINLCWKIYQDANFKIGLSLFVWKENILLKQHIVQCYSRNLSLMLLLVFSQCYWYWLSSSTNDRRPRVAVTEELVVDGSDSLTEAELVRTMRRRRKKPLMSMIMLGGVESAEEELSVVIQCLKVRGGLQKNCLQKLMLKGESDWGEVH